MKQDALSLPGERGPVRFSYAFIVLTLALAGWFHLAVMLLAVLFTHLALSRLFFWKRRGKWSAVGLFVLLLVVALYGVGYVVDQAIRALPSIAEKAIPSLLSWAEANNLNLPFTDYASLKEVALDAVKNEVALLGSFARVARGATEGFVLVLVGCIVGVCVFFDPRVRLEAETPGAPTDLYAACCDAIARRFQTFYESFDTVIGAQILISAINTVLTTGFVFITGLPNAIVVIGLTFLFGLLPVVGNLVTNTLVVLIGFTVSPRMALAALIFLVVVHKLEYFLNSKIIGHRIRNPLWLTLVGLVLGERLMGVPGMILAPVILYYLKLEASRLRAGGPSAEAQPR